MGGSLKRGNDFLGVSVQGGSLSRGISVQGRVSAGGSLSREISVQGSLQGGDHQPSAKTISHLHNRILEFFPK